jgi:ComF family protein
LNLLTVFGRSATAGLDFIYPPLCAACDVRIDEPSFLCSGCMDALADAVRPTVCDTRPHFPYLTGECSVDDVVPVWRPAPVLEKLIYRMKYTHAPGTARFLGREMGRTLLRTLERERWAAVIPVPLHPVRRRERGYNQSELLAREIARATSIPGISRRLRRIRPTVSQTTLSAEARQLNVKDVFAWRCRGETPAQICLVDDVVTTGATVNACATILKRAGARSVIVLCCLRPPLLQTARR